jgi:hypothetical protein
MAIIGRYPFDAAQADESSGQEKEIEQVQG